MSVIPTARDISVSQAVVETVAEAEGVDPVDLDVPLFEAVDPEALDRFVQSVDGSDSSVRVSFTYYGYELAVTADGSVRISE